MNGNTRQGDQLVFTNLLDLPTIGVAYRRGLGASQQPEFSYWTLKCLSSRKIKLLFDLFLPAGGRLLVHSFVAFEVA